MLRERVIFPVLTQSLSVMVNHVSNITPHFILCVTAYPLNHEKPRKFQQGLQPVVHSPASDCVRRISLLVDESCYCGAVNHHAGNINLL